MYMYSLNISNNKQKYHEQTSRGTVWASTSSIVGWLRKLAILQMNFWKKMKDKFHGKYGKTWYFVWIYFEKKLLKYSAPIFRMRQIQFPHSPDRDISLVDFEVSCFRENTIFSSFLSLFLGSQIGWISNRKYPFKKKFDRPPYGLICVKS